MGFWSKLAKGLAIGGAGLGTVLTAGAASPALAGALGMSAGTSGLLGGIASGASGILSKIGKGIGPTASGIAAGMTKGREEKNLNAQKSFEDKLAESQNNEANLENRLKLSTEFENNAYRNAQRSALAKNIQDVNLTGGNPRIPVMHFTGGSRPSAMGPEGRAAADVMNKKAMLELMNGDQLPALDRPAMPTFENAGPGENTLGTIGAIGNAANGIMADNQAQSQTKTLIDKINQIVAANNAKKPPVYWNFDQFGAPGAANGSVQQPTNAQDDGQ